MVGTEASGAAIRPIVPNEHRRLALDLAKFKPAVGNRKVGVGLQLEAGPARTEAAGPGAGCFQIGIAGF
jgi:hypothetical protein